MVGSVRARRLAGVNAGPNLSRNRRPKPSRSALLVAAQHLLALASEPEALAVEDDDLGIVDEAIDHRGDVDRVAEDLGPRR